MGDSVTCMIDLRWFKVPFSSTDKSPLMTRQWDKGISHNLLMSQSEVVSSVWPLNGNQLIEFLMPGCHLVPWSGQQLFLMPKMPFAYRSIWLFLICSVRKKLCESRFLFLFSWICYPKPAVYVTSFHCFTDFYFITIISASVFLRGPRMQSVIRQWQSHPTKTASSFLTHWTHGSSAKRR